jgi:hypothetical protein
MFTFDKRNTERRKLGCVRQCEAKIPVACFPVKAR